VQVLTVLLTGLLLFFIGLRIMTGSLKMLAGPERSVILERCSGNRYSAFMCGLLFTSLTQSSSLTTVLVVGAVDAGLLTFRAALAMIIGANVGTTVTGQLLTVGLVDLAAQLIVAGTAAAVVIPLGRARFAALALTGLGLLLYGLKVMSLVLLPLSQAPWFVALLSASQRHPLLGVLAGMAAASVVQSSSAVIGVVLMLAQTGRLSLEAGISLVLGADIGTCVTALLAGLGAGVTARRAALAHLLFNVCSAVLVLSFFPLFVNFSSVIADSLPRQLANAHTLYNLSGAIVLLLLLRPFQRLTELLHRMISPGEKRSFRFPGER
jgi:phosphate:Na+ symporter